MPIYEYFCKECKTKFELLLPVSMSGEDGQCPRCQTQSKRTITGFIGRSRSSDSPETASLAGTGSDCAGCTASSCKGCQV